MIVTLPTTLKKTVMSTLENFVEKGEEFGIDKTLLKNTRNMLFEGFSIDTICKILGVTPDYVTRVQSELQ
jgi:hypothetical protein